MPQPGYPYACARISALETGILDAASIRRMAEGSLDDAMRMLADARYGGASNVSASGAEALIASELARTAREVRALSPEPALTDLFLLENDVLNLKLLIKGRLLGAPPAEWREGGLFTKEQLTAMVTAQDYRALPPLLAQGLDKLEKRLKTRVEPQQVSVMLDQAYLAHCLAVAETDKSPFARQYFAALCDFDNVITFFRMRAMGVPREDMRDMLLPAGGIPEKTLLDGYELSFEGTSRILQESSAKSALAAGLSEMQRTGEIGALEKARDDYLLSLVKAHKHDTMTIFPVLGYLLAREREAKAIRLILTVKRNGLEDSVIAGRLRELYD